MGLGERLMERMNFGIVGTGGIALMMAKACEEVEGVHAYGLYSRTYEKGKEFANEANIDFVYTDYDEFLSDENLDFIYLASPNSLHYPQAKKAIQAHKNVIVEKPFCSNYQEAKELVELAESNDVYLFESMTILHSNNYKLLQEKLSEIGKIKEVQCTYLQYSRKYKDLLEGKEPNVFNKKYAGGALMDLGIYNIHFVVGLFGEPKEVTYYARNHENGIDLGGTLIMEYEDKVVSALAAKDLNGSNRNIIAGEDGYIIVEGGSNGPKPFSIYTSEKQEHFDVENDKSWFYNELKDICDIYNGHDKDKMKSLLNNSLMAMRVIDKAKKSAGISFEED